MKDTFVVYTSYLEKFSRLSDEQMGMLFRAMMEYQKTGEEPLIVDMAVCLCFDVVKCDMDDNNKKYEAMCEKQRQNVMKRWENRDTTVSDGIPSDTTVYHGIPPYTTDTNHTDNDNDTDTDNESDNDNDSVKKEDAKASKKEPKHKYGQYKNVLLSDSELEKLKDEFFYDWEERIERLSEYIESKGTKYKNHLATIRSWARKEKPGKSKNESSSETQADFLAEWTREREAL